MSEIKLVRAAPNVIIAITLILATLGVIMIASTSSAQAVARYDDETFFLKRQLGALVIGFIAAIACMRIPYQHWRKLAPWIAGAAVVLLIMALIPGVGLEINGSRRWLRFGPVNVQPSELGKFALIVLVAAWMSRYQRHVEDFKKGLLIPMLFIGLFLGLVIKSPDYGTTLLMAVTAVGILYVGGTRLGYLLILGVSGAVAFALAIMSDPIRMRRVLAFLHPEDYADREGYQLLHAIYAFVIGGFEGVGLGESLQKRFYLPEAHNDFILAILGEELGLIASLGVVALFAVFLFYGLLVSYRAQDTFGRLLAFGITVSLGLQAAFNIGVVTGCLPTKGLPLPFISYGGTSLVMSLCMTGVLVNVALQAAQPGVVPRRASRPDDRVITA
jgi:cell division protein FtsW